MPLKKAKKTNNETVEQTVEQVTPVDSQNITADEVEAIQKQEDIPTASTKKLQLAIQLLAGQFNIDDTFDVFKVDDKGNTMTIGFANLDYAVTIKIKDCTEMGINV